MPVRNRQTGEEVRLETYVRLQQSRGLDAGLVHRILGGLSTRDHGRCAGAIPEAFGLSASTVSRRFRRATARTLHRLGVMASLGISLKTTNIVESINARLGTRTDKIDHWRNSDQGQRRLATALLDLEPHLRRIRGHHALPLLRAALKAHLCQTATAARGHRGADEFQPRMA